ncbi:CcdC protein domain-containing protein [Streptomyces prunicolor]|uniref:CcdC protein domain-containing protein n=1 Tax=Streptomyces prunicolor TaxID=67348 RepID=A0ABU4FLU5_9ACTN|nr:CcdC protein domain-containing protein [Streptomyces prunicolor]MDV7221563.1 CcdC protein domain-containing protein [Streptomyces prunicolor]
MSGLVNALVIVAVVAVVIVRQFRARRIDTDRRWWLLPAILAVVALREPGILDAHHHTESALLLAVELVVGLATGAGWAWTTRLWVETDGSVWSKSTKASGGVWIVGIALRVGLVALGAVVGVHQDSSALMLGLAATLLVRSGVLAWRAQSFTGSAGSAPAYGFDVARPTGKERV